LIAAIESDSIDWQIKENLRVRLRVEVKKLLRKYGYLPDMEKLAIDTVLEQAELNAENII
jgi:type I restriction enzyme R subunit